MKAILIKLTFKHEHKYNGVFFIPCFFLKYKYFPDNWVISSGFVILSFDSKKFFNSGLSSSIFVLTFCYYGLQENKIITEYNVKGANKTENENPDSIIVWAKPREKSFESRNQRD